MMLSKVDSAGDVINMTTFPNSGAERNAEIIANGIVNRMIRDEDEEISVSKITVMNTTNTGTSEHNNSILSDEEKARVIAAIERSQNTEKEDENNDTLDLTSKKLETFNALNFRLYPENNFSYLKILILEDNCISNFEGMNLTRLAVLTDLDLSYNCFSGIIPDGVFPVSLERLDISHNSIEKLNGLFNCSELHTLNASHNKIKYMSAYPHTLHTLDISNNHISNIVDLRLLSHTPSITTLTLTLNPVSSKPLYRPTVCSVLPLLKTLDDISTPAHNVRKRSVGTVRHPHPTPTSLPTPKHNTNNKDNKDNNNITNKYPSNMNKKQQEEADRNRTKSNQLKLIEVDISRAERERDLLYLAGTTYIDQDTTDRMLKRLQPDSLESGTGSEIFDVISHLICTFSLSLFPPLISLYLKSGTGSS